MVCCRRTARRPWMRAAAEREKSRIRQWNPGTHWTQRLERVRIAAGHRPGTCSAQDCQSVRIYASEQCPRQDSNLRSRLRRPILFTASTWQNAPFPSAWGAYGGSAGYELLDQDAATSFDQRQGRGARASWSAAWWSTHTGAVNSQQTDDADRLAAAAKRQRPVRGFRGGFPGSP